MIKTRIISIDPRQIRLLELNARFMRHEVFARLVDNLRQDGALTGNNPFCWRLHDDTTQQPIPAHDGSPIYEVLSGNHRVKAAVAAGLPTIDVVVTDDYLPPDRRRAIQLSHNAIVGEDDPATLKLIYQEIDNPELRLYTGLDDKTLKLLESVDVTSLKEASLEFQTIALTFLPHEIDQVQAAFDTARSQIKASGYWLTRFADYDRALDALEMAGQAYDVKNTATALMIILSVFTQHLTDLQDGFLDQAGEPTGKRRVPIAAVLGRMDIPAATAAKLKKALARQKAPDPITALNQLLED